MLEMHFETFFYRLNFDGYFEMTTKLISLGKLLNHLSNQVDVGSIESN